jgi:polysaccharide export outer membrane protein
VSVPTLGKLYVKGLTIEQTRQLIQKKVSEILNDAVVNVRLTSFNVTFLGEVNMQGRIPFYKEKVNVLEAIGSAGGLTYYGNKKHVKVIRPQDTVMKVYNIDLTNVHILEQKEFYLYPNDIVYVPPRRSKDFFDFSRDYSSIISMITGTISTTLLIMQLNKQQ